MSRQGESILIFQDSMHALTLNSQFTTASGEKNRERQAQSNFGGRVKRTKQILSLSVGLPHVMNSTWQLKLLTKDIHKWSLE